MQGLAPPVYLNLLTGGRCRLRCPFCRSWRVEVPELPAEEWVGTLKAIAGWMPGHPVNLAGGEPLSHPGIERIVRATAELGLPANVSTSGDPFTDELVRAFPGWGADGIALSLDGPADVHDRLRGSPGLFRRGLDALDYFKEVRPDLRTTIATVINAATLPRIRELTAFLLAKPQVERLYFQAIIYFGEMERWGTPERLPYWPDRDEALAFLDWLDQQRAHTEKIINTTRQTDLWRRYFTDPLSVFELTGPCRVGRYTLTVKADGDVSLCDLHEPIGNVRRDDPRSLWEGHAARALRERMQTCRFPCVYLVNCSFEDVHLEELSDDEMREYIAHKRAGDVSA